MSSSVAMLVQPLRKSSVARKKPPTSQIRMALDVIELAWKCAPHHGYRGGGAAGDYLSDLLRPILLADEESRRTGGSKPKGNKP